MKIEQRAIAGKLKQLKGIVPAKSTLPVTGILFKRNTLTANNLELALSAALGIDTSEEFILPMKAVEMIESLPGGVIDIHADGQKIIIKSDIGTSRFMTFSVEDFPEVSAGAQTMALTLDSEKVAAAVGKVIYASSINPTKPVMGGVLFEGDGEHLNIVACDGYRMAWCQLDYEEKFAAIIPRATLQKVFSIGFKGYMALNLKDRNKAVIWSGDYTCHTRLIEGNFIEYRPMFEKEFKQSITVNRLALMSSLTRAQICNEDKAYTPVIFNIDGTELSISLQTATSEFSESIQIPETDKELRIGFNVKYLIEALKSFDEETVDMNFGSPLEPMMIAGKTMKALVLPVRLKG